MFPPTLDIYYGNTRTSSAHFGIYTETIGLKVGGYSRISEVLTFRNALISRERDGEPGPVPATALGERANWRFILVEHIRRMLRSRSCR